MAGVKSLNQFRCFDQRLKPLYPTAVGTLICLLSIELPSSAAFAQLTTIASTETVSVNLPTASSSLLIAQTEDYGIGAENFNPRLQAPLPQTEEVKIKPQPLIPIKPNTALQTIQSNPPKQQESASTTTKPLPAKGVVIILESVAPNFHNTLNDSGQVNQTAETTVNFGLENGDRVKLVTGYNTFIKPGFTTINNVPINLSWETKIDSVKIEPSIGVNLFDRLSTSFSYGLKASIPITSDLTLSAAVEAGAYKFNTETIQNQVSSVRYGPGIAWKIDKNTSFLATYKLGNYSDGNTENQLFSRLEHKSGQFWIAGNLFSWGYGQNIGAASGYFSPADFLAYSGEVGVEGNVLFDSLHCRLSATLGSQISDGASTIGQAFQALCKTKLSPSLEASFGYGLGNSRKDFSTEETGNTRTITGGLIYRF